MSGKEKPWICDERIESVGTGSMGDEVGLRVRMSEAPVGIAVCKARRMAGEGIDDDDLIVNGVLASGAQVLGEGLVVEAVNRAAAILACGLYDVETGGFDKPVKIGASAG
jgi:hypothetical protein